MKRVKLGVAILLALVLLSVSVTLTVHQQTGRLLEQLDALEEIAETGDWEAAEEPFAAFTAQWERTEKLLGFLVWRERLLDVDETITHLDPMRVADCDELKSELEEARMWIERLRDGETPGLRNIF